MSNPPDDDPTGATTARAGDGGGNGKPGVSVNWRGIVDEDTPEPKSVRMAHSVRSGFSSLLTALGLKRKRRSDGSLAPRPWGRIVVIWGGLLLVLLLVSSAHVVGAGNVGVPVTLGSAGDPLDPGFHFTAPWPFTRVPQMSTRTQNYTMTAGKGGEGQIGGSDDSVLVLGRDGAQANVDATVLYHVGRDDATFVYENVGTDFSTAIVRPSARACIRTEFTRRDLVTASTADWPEISQNITNCMRDKIEPRGITLEDFQLRDVSLSPQVQQAIEASVAARQTTGEDLSDAYLQFAYIQALRSLANSPNNNTIVLPTDSGLTPTLPLTGNGTLAPEGATP
jgi:hypothetical protein